MDVPYDVDSLSEPDLDRLVEEVILGRQSTPSGGWVGPGGQLIPARSTPCSDEAATEEIIATVQNLRGFDFRSNQRGEGHWYACFGITLGGYWIPKAEGYGETRSVAACRAALKTVPPPK
jgi:hypothetical protein